MKTTGTKAELLNRLQNGETVIEKTETDAKPLKEGKSIYDKLKLIELKSLCEEKGLVSTGRKADLIVRLKELDLSLLPKVENESENNVSGSSSSGKCSRLI